MINLLCLYDTFGRSKIVTVLENFQEINQKMRQACERSGRNIADVSVIAVTKYVSVERTKEALKAGITQLGENRLEGLLDKYSNIKEEATWHFIGSLQSRKVKEVIDFVDFIHSLDRKSLAKEINKRANRKVPCFVQVNVSGETSKHGLNPEDVESFIEQLKHYENVEVVGLMTMAPNIEDEAVLRETFQQLRKLKEKIEAKKQTHAPCHYLSMGMSNDYELAIEEGATHIRVGSALVGNEEKGRGEN